MKRKHWLKPTLLLFGLALTSMACSFSANQTKPTLAPVKPENTSPVLVKPTLASTSTPVLAITPTAVPAPTETSPSNRASALFMPAGDAKQQLISAFLKLNTTYPFRVTETGTYASGDGSESTRITDFAAADRSHSTWTGVLNKGEMIRIGQDVYMKLNGGDWTSGYQGGTDIEQLTALMIAGLQEVQSAGTETLVGVDTTSYTFKAQVSDILVTGKAWIGATDGLPRRADLEMQVSGATLVTSLVYEYGIQVTIEAPVP